VLVCIGIVDVGEKAVGSVLVVALDDPLHRRRRDHRLPRAGR
jgi:hypothetical protein